MEHMEPRHLPRMWSVDHHHDELSGMGEAIQVSVDEEGGDIEKDEVVILGWRLKMLKS